MENFGTVTICMKVHNTKPYLEQCISSVLSQTYADFEYFLLDNNCTDGSSEIMERFAQKDSRIHLIRQEVNQPMFFWQPFIEKFATGRYLAFIDSDDWWDADCLERLLTFLNKNGLDYAITGTINYFEATHKHRVLRQVEQPVYFTPAEFARKYPYYWTFPSTVWGSVVKTQLYLKAELAPLYLDHEYIYGLDTMEMLQYIKVCSKIGIDNSALYHYRIHPKSISYRYEPKRFVSNIACYEQIKEFLTLYGAFDPVKQEWLKQTHLQAMVNTLNRIQDANLPMDKKISECAQIAAHPLTRAVLTTHCGARDQWLAVMWEIVFSSPVSGPLPDPKDLHAVLQVLSPRCCAAVQPSNIGLFMLEPSIREALKSDNKRKLAALLLEMIVQNRYSKQYDLGQIIHALTQGESPLHKISDARFFRKYADICGLIIGKKYLTALDMMTQALLNGDKLYAPEAFLDLYLSLSALEEQAPAFIYGKLQLARLYLNTGCKDQCQSIINELIEMGVDNEELTALQQELIAQ